MQPRHSLRRSPRKNPQTPFRILGVAIALLSLTGCGDSPSSSSSPFPEDDTPDVAVTNTILADLTAQVGSDEIDLVSILQPGADPHVYEPVPRDSIAFETADLILYNGYNLEPGLVRMMNATGTTAEKVAIAEVIPPLGMEYEGRIEPDPHVWGSAEHAIAMTEAIRDALIALDADSEAVFRANADQLITELENLHIWIGEQIATIPQQQRRLVTTHDAFQYYMTTYGLEDGGTLIGISTEEQPSAQTVQALVDSIQASGVPAIFAETTINPRLISTVADEAGVTLASEELYSDSIGTAGSPGDSYINMMVANTRTIVENLGGEYTAFAAE